MGTFLSMDEMPLFPPSLLDRAPDLLILLSECLSYSIPILILSFLLSYFPFHTPKLNDNESPVRKWSDEEGLCFSKNGLKGIPRIRFNSFFLLGGLWYFDQRISSFLREAADEVLKSSL